MRALTKLFGRYGILKKWSLFLTLLLVFIFTAACSEDSVKSSEKSGETTPASGEVTEGGTIKIGVLASLTGALESYGKQTRNGIELGLEYATDGTMEVAGKKSRLYSRIQKLSLRLQFKKQRNFWKKMRLIS